MSNIMKTLVTGAALLAAAPAAVAQPFGEPDLGRFDATRAQTLGQQLVLCDLASYFGTGPNLDAHRVYVKRDTNWFDPMPPQAITRGVHWHDYDLERAFLRHRAAGRVSAQEVDALRGQYGAEMERVFQRTTVGERRFFQRQARFCRELVRQSWR